MTTEKFYIVLMENIYLFLVKQRASWKNENPKPKAIAVSSMEWADRIHEALKIDNYVREGPKIL